MKQILTLRMHGWTAVVLLGTLIVVRAQSEAPTGVTVHIDEPPKARPGELVQNPDFEKPLAVRAGSDVIPGVGRIVTNLPPAWYWIVEGGAQGSMTLEALAATNQHNHQAMSLTVTTPGGRCGVANDGFSGMNIEGGQWYDLTFRARIEPRDNNRGYGLMVSLESRDGEKVCARATIPEVGSASWKGYTLPLHARESDPRARLVISMDEPGVITFDDVSLVRRKSSDGRQ